jgi:hypothetical protein
MSGRLCGRAAAINQSVLVGVLSCAWEHFVVNRNLQTVQKTWQETFDLQAAILIKSVTDRGKCRPTKTPGRRNATWQAAKLI